MAGVAAGAGARNGAGVGARGVARRGRLWTPYLALLVAFWRATPLARFRGACVALGGMVLLVALASWRADDPALNAASGEPARNLLGRFGANIADLVIQPLGLSAGVLALVLVVSGLARLMAPRPDAGRAMLRMKTAVAVLGVVALSGLLAALPVPAAWPLARGLGGFAGDGFLAGLSAILHGVGLPAARGLAAGVLTPTAATALGFAAGIRGRDFLHTGAWLAWAGRWLGWFIVSGVALLRRGEIAPAGEAAPARRRATPKAPAVPEHTLVPVPVPEPAPQVLNIRAPKASNRESREKQKTFEFVHPGGFALPELAMLAKPKPRDHAFDEAALRQNARLLETVLGEFGVRGTIDQIRPGPVVTLYELSPAAGVKSSRVIGLSDDIARSMSARSARVSVVPGRNAIGIELPNAKRETVYLRDLLSSAEYEKQSQLLPLALGETIGGEPYVADLAKMPHLLIAGTTGSGKSVGVNAMILSILYRLSPAECRFIMIDPKMLELSVYDGIPHLLAPVVTDPKKAIVALKWTVREMENRYRLMSKLGVRNIGGYNDRAREAQAKGEHFERTVQTGFDDQGRPVYESEKLRPEPMPFLVVVIDEVADLMMVAGKDIEGAVQRLAQMARAAGIHLIMATQRPSVDVITGTIKANFPTRISFQVTSKIDARTILGEQGAEQLLGQGDMLYMAGGGRVTRLHGPFVSDQEVEDVATFLRDQGEPQYLDEITAAPDEDGEGDDGLEGGSGDDLYDQAVAVVTRDRKASTSYIQRRLQIGYNRAASLIEKMEREGVVSPANHAGKRDILAGPPP